MKTFSVSGDWTEVAPGVRVRLRDAPNEEDMQEFYALSPGIRDGIVLLEVEQF